MNRNCLKSFLTVFMAISATCIIFIIPQGNNSFYVDAVTSSVNSLEININTESLNILKEFYFDGRRSLNFIIDRNTFSPGSYTIGVTGASKEVDLILTVHFVNGSMIQVNENGYGEVELACVDISIVNNILVTGSGAGGFEFIIAKLEERIHDGREPNLKSFDRTLIEGISSGPGTIVGYADAYKAWSTPVTIISSKVGEGDIRVIYKFLNRWMETPLYPVRTKMDRSSSELPFAGIVVNVDLDSPVMIVFGIYNLEDPVTYGIFSPLDLSNFTNIGVYPYKSRLFSDKNSLSLLFDTINFFYLFKLRANSTFLFTLFQLLPRNPQLLVEYEIKVFDVDSTNGFLTEIGHILYCGSLKPLNCTRIIVNTAMQEKHYLVWVYAYPLYKTYLDEVVRCYNLTIEELNEYYFWALQVLSAQELTVNSRILESIEDIKLYKVALAPGVYFLSLEIETTLANGQASIFSIQKPYEEFLISSKERPLSLYVSVPESSEYFLQITPSTTPFVYSLSINYALDLRSYGQLIDNMKKMNESLDFPMSYLITSKSLIEIELERQKVLEYYNKGDAQSALALSSVFINRINNEIRLTQLVLIILPCVGLLFGILNKGKNWIPVITPPVTIVITLIVNGYHLLLVLTALVAYGIMLTVGYRIRKVWVKKKK